MQSNENYKQECPVVTRHLVTAIKEEKKNGTQCGSNMGAEAYYLKRAADPLYEKKVTSELF